MTNKSRGDYAYTMIDTHSAIGGDILSELKEIDGTIRVTLFKEQ